jgi:hypothetical protein
VETYLSCYRRHELFSLMWPLLHNGESVCCDVLGTSRRCRNCLCSDGTLEHLSVFIPQSDR